MDASYTSTSLYVIRVRASHVKTEAFVSFYLSLTVCLSLSLSLSTQDNAYFFAYTFDGRGSEGAREEKGSEWAGCSRPRAALMSN